MTEKACRPRAWAAPGTAIAVTGLKMTLQTWTGNPYHTVPRHSLDSGPIPAMDDQAVNRRSDAVETLNEMGLRAERAAKQGNAVE